MWAINLFMPSYCTGLSTSEPILGRGSIPPSTGQLQNSWHWEIALLLFLAGWWACRLSRCLLASICCELYCCVLLSLYFVAFWVVLCCGVFAEPYQTSVINVTNQAGRFDEYWGTGVWDLTSSLKWPWVVGFDLDLFMCLISSRNHGWF